MTKEEFAIELRGIVGTIKTYTRNPFMMGYTEQLQEAIDKDDTQKAKLVLDRVLKWYNREIEKIQHDEYIFNKNMHEKAYYLLREYRQNLQC